MDGDNGIDNTQEHCQSPGSGNCTVIVEDRDQSTDQHEWCEETSGDQIVYDATYEQNEDLVPWNQNRHKHWGVEQWGMYL